MTKTLLIHADDNVAVAIAALEKGTTLEIGGKTIVLNEDIPAGHKFALRDIGEGADIVKYGSRIGFAKADIKQGDWVHVQNLRTALSGKIEYKYEPVEIVEKTRTAGTFMGYQRENGKVGVRNEIWIIPTVGCVNGIVEALQKIGAKIKPDGVDEVVAFPHPYGCSQLGDDQESTRKILADLVNHPNAGGVIVVGLGCENSGIKTLKEYIGEYNPERVKFMNSQDHEDEIEFGEQLLKEVMAYSAAEKRTEVPTSKLIVGLKCGGSDGFSGITANPVVGSFSDLLIAEGGATILTEVPEMFGAEQSLMNRAQDEDVYHRTVDLINNFKEYYEKSGMPIYENPSPGNKDGGISTLEDKSLGCTQKSGSSTVRDVLEYGEVVKKSGLNLLSAPGNDLVAATALAASGAQIVLFTTGRGTPFASPVPTVKISSNTALFTRKNKWIDFNAGYAVEGKTIDELGEELLEFVVQIASGKLVKSEEMGFHDMAIFKTGVTL